MFDLSGRKALIVGIANEHSIAYGCAKAMRAQGADLAVTWLNDKAERFVRPLGEALGAQILAPFDVTRENEAEQLFGQIATQWGALDIVVHSVAYCPKEDLHGRVVDCSAEGFSQAMDISVHSFLRLIRRAEPFMPQGGVALTVTFYGSGEVVKDYNVMGPVKAALESVTRYAAMELGPKGIRVHALSPGPLATRAASGIDHFDQMMDDAARRAPTHMLATIDQIGAYAAFLASDVARNVTGGIHPIDGGLSIMG